MAGKTGTAQKLDPVNGGYLANEHIASFCGFGPVEDPAAVCLVVLDNPRGVYYGGIVTAPVFSEVMGQIMHYLGIPSSDELQGKASHPSSAVTSRADAPIQKTANGNVILPDFRGWSIRDAGDWLDRAGIGFMPNGTGSASSQDPQPGTAVQSGDNVKVWFSQ